MKPLKILSRIGVVLLIVAAAALLVRAVFSYSEGRKLAGAVAELKAQGVALTARDLASACPDADNAARLWRAAADLLAIGKDDKGLLGRAFTDLVASKPLSPADRDAIEGVIARNREALGLLYLMADKPCFLYRDPGTSPAETMIPDAVEMISAARLMGFDALLLADEGDTAGAIDRIRRALGSTSKVAQEGTLLTHLIAMAETRMLLRVLEDICRGRTVDDETLLRLVADLEPGPWRERLARSISGERVFNLERGSAIIGGSVRALAGERPYNRLLYWLLRPIIKDEVRWRLKEFAGWERIAGKPYFQQRELLKTDAGISEEAPWYFKLTGFQDAGAYGTVFLKNGQLEATFLAARTGLACRLYKSRTGQYPEDLETLVPAILKEVPIDPFTGKPFVYRREGEGFIVYSLGSNEKDDGGRSTFMVTQMIMDKDDDWAWKEDR